jgi:hypothetical protein
MLEASSSQKLRFEEEPKPFYFLEFYGETNPQVDPAYAEVVAGKGGSSAGPIYEYFWTLGLYDPPQPPQASKTSTPNRKRLHVRPTASAPSSGWGKFAADSSAQVYVLFPRSSGWRVHELAASVKYLAPVPMQKSFVQEMDKDIAALQPLLGVAGTAASAVGAVGAGPAASATGHVLDAMAKMKVGSVPQAPGFEWSVKKFTTWVHKSSDTDSPAEAGAGELVDGIVWNIPPSMFETLGSRINGSIAVSLLPLSNQNSSTSALGSGIVRASATLPLDSGPIDLPDDDYVCLEVRPQKPGTVA